MDHLYGSMLIIAFIILLPKSIKTQTYSDFLGNGHKVGISVTSSSENANDLDDNAIAGSGLFPDDKGASRFLAQATMGANYETIEDVVNIGIDAWLENQFSVTPNSFESEFNRIYNEALPIVNNNVRDKNEYLTFTFYETLIKHPDVLRQKVSFALSQIFVISPTNSLLNSRAFHNSNYYDILHLGAFGNFRDIIYDVTLHPCMGIYLGHLQNQKADIVQGTLPDENFAREIMQLFSIGLYELNLDGSFKRDSNGELISTYDINDIQELARVLTGLSGSARLDGNPPLFHDDIGGIDLSVPMSMYYDFHDKSEKVLIDNSVIPANQQGLTDIDRAVDNLFNHPNVGPFIGTRLIQHLVKSNPSPQYIYRVSSVFNDDGTGIRGNMQAVVKAILTDPEARDCSWINDATSGKLIQPIQRLTNLFLAFDISSPSNKFWFNDEADIFDEVQQAFLASPTVFNFFSPFYSEKEFVEANDLVSPEFQILNSTTGIYYLNQIENSLKIRPFRNRTLVSNNGLGLQNNPDDLPVLDFSDEIAIYQSGGLQALIDRLDLIICRGQLNPDVKNIIIGTLAQNIQNDSTYGMNNIIHDALYFIMITPNYTILK